MKRFIQVALALILALAMTGCGGDLIQEGGGENSIIDGNGRVHELPEDPSQERIALVYGVATPFMVALDLSDQMVGMNMKTKFWEEAVPTLADVEMVGRGQVDLEALAASGATVLVHRSNDLETVEAVEEKLGIPVIAIDAETLGDMKNSFEMLGKYFGKAERALEINDWMDEKFALIDELTADIPADERTRAVVLGGELGKVAGGDMLQSELLEKAGGTSLSKDIENGRRWSEVGLETLFSWDPVFIFATGSSVLEYRIEDVLTDPTWSDVTAVKLGQFHQIPAGYDSWDMPGVAAPLASMYMMQKMYPDRMTTAELQEQIDEYYMFMFGQTFDPEYLKYDLED